MTNESLIIKSNLCLNKILWRIPQYNTTLIDNYSIPEPTTGGPNGPTMTSDLPNSSLRRVHHLVAMIYYVSSYETNLNILEPFPFACVTTIWMCSKFENNSLSLDDFERRWELLLSTVIVLFLLFKIRISIIKITLSDRKNLVWQIRVLLQLVYSISYIGYSTPHRTNTC